MLAGQGALERAIEVTEHLLRLAPTLDAAHRALLGYYAAALTLKRLALDRSMRYPVM